MFLEIFACFAATCFFSFLLDQPLKTIVLSGLIGSLGYVVFVLLGKSALAYFMAAFLISVLSEITARILKRASTVFLISSLIPLVPGIGLYRTMRYLVDQETQQAVTMGIDTILGFCAIALGITISAIIFSNIHVPFGRNKKQADKTNL